MDEASTLNEWVTFGDHLYRKKGDDPSIVFTSASGEKRTIVDYDGNIIMIWQVQPDGMYWRDEDGYGMTPDEEIRLYSFIDRNGRFTAPFKIYNIGTKQFYVWRK